MEDRSYAIVGTGALGGYYGGLLAHAGLATHFLLRSDFNHVKQHGLRIDSVRGDFALPAERVHAYRDPADLPPCDMAVVCLKTTQNDQLPELLEHCVKPDGVVLVLQNGLQPEADAAAVVGDDRVLGGLCFLCSNKVGPGHIQHLDYGHIHLGKYTEAVDESHFRGIVADFNAAGIETTAVDDLRLSRWKKLVWNIPYNGLSVVLNQTTDVMMAEPPTRCRIETIMHEVQAAALAVDGKMIAEEFIQTMLDYTAKMKPYKTSMMLDFEAGRPMEVEAIVGDPLREAQRVELPAPHMSELDQELRSLIAADLPLAYRPLPRFAFGDSAEMADELAALVVGGRKRATCWAHAQPEDPHPQPGDCSVVLDGRGRPVCVTETLSVDLRRFDEVDDAFAAAEGEGDLSLGDWRRFHRDFFTRHGVFTPDMLLYCEEFRLVERLGPRD